jgi:hypothetical protein
MALKNPIAQEGIKNVSLVAIIRYCNTKTMLMKVSAEQLFPTVLEVNKRAKCIGHGTPASRWSDPLLYI